MILNTARALPAPGHWNSEELLNLFELLLRAQLNTIRQFRKAAGIETEPEKETRRSQIDIVYDILVSAQRPMHIDDIIAQARRRFEIQQEQRKIGMLRI